MTFHQCELIDAFWVSWLSKFIKAYFTFKWLFTSAKSLMHFESAENQNLLKHMSYLSDFSQVWTHWCFFEVCFFPKINNAYLTFKRIFTNGSSKETLHGWWLLEKIESHFRFDVFEKNAHSWSSEFNLKITLKSEEFLKYLHKIWFETNDI